MLDPGVVMDIDVEESEGDGGDGTGEKGMSVSPFVAGKREGRYDEG